MLFFSVTNWLSSVKISKLLNVDLVVVEGLECCFFPENINTLSSVKVVGCMNG